MPIYIIDDEAISLFVTEQVLRLEGVTSSIRTFAGANEALRFLRSHLAVEMPEIIFLDLNMPVMNGWDFLEELQPYTAALAGCCRIYILTSSLALSDTARAKNFPLVTGIIHKPLGDAELRSILYPVTQTAAV